MSRPLMVPGWLLEKFEDLCKAVGTGQMSLFDESKVSRHGKGSSKGGQFAPKGGAKQGKSPSKKRPSQKQSRALEKPKKRDWPKEVLAAVRAAESGLRVSSVADAVSVPYYHPKAGSYGKEIREALDKLVSEGKLALFDGGDRVTIPGRQQDAEAARERERQAAIAEEEQWPQRLEEIVVGLPKRLSQKKVAERLRAEFAKELRATHIVSDEAVEADVMQGVGIYDLMHGYERPWSLSSEEAVGGAEMLTGRVRKSLIVVLPGGGRP